jgi:nitroimidazol reductase NimA-like FMN-containing flavoprotein (pyridoxamine 5'-phosphate oxidase superfamily)
MTVEELGEYGMEEMDDAEVERFLSSQSMGVLGLPTEDTPYLLPMSYGFDGGSSLYFFYVVGEQSRKDELSTQTKNASFLVYSAETAFNWESVLMTGRIRKLPEENRTDIMEDVAPSWRPELFETASKIQETHLYEFRIQEWTGIKHTGIPQGFA